MIRQLVTQFLNQIHQSRFCQLTYLAAGNVGRVQILVLEWKQTFRMIESGD